MGTTNIPTITSKTGQSGELRLRLTPRGGRTEVAERYARTPFGAVRANYPDDSGIPEVQITNPSGGTLGGDRLKVAVTLAPGSCASVLTQAANKAYRGPESEQRAVFHVGEGALLEYLPHHLIPFAGSSYRQAAELYLAESAALIFWDAFSAGRVARGERFAFDRLRSMTRVWRAGVPEVIDGLDLHGGAEPYGGYSYMAAVYVVAARDLGPLAEELHDLLHNLPGVLASASAPSPGLCAVRALADGAPALYRALNRTRDLARKYLGIPYPAREVN